MFITTLFWSVFLMHHQSLFVDPCCNATIHQSVGQENRPAAGVTSFLCLVEVFWLIVGDL